MVVFANSLLSAAATDYSNGRTMSVPQFEHQRSRQQPKKLTKKKKTGKKTKQVDAQQQAENLILNTKFSDESNDFHDRHEVHPNSMGGHISPQMCNGAHSPQFDKQEHKFANTPDILSMVLSMKKNAMMHDPYVIQFLSSIR